MSGLRILDFEQFVTPMDLTGRFRTAEFFQLALCRKKKVDFFALRPVPRTADDADSVLSSYKAGPFKKPFHIHYLGGCSEKSEQE